MVRDDCLIKRSLEFLARTIDPRPKRLTEFRIRVNLLLAFSIRGRSRLHDREWLEEEGCPHLILEIEWARRYLREDAVPLGHNGFGFR